MTHELTTVNQSRFDVIRKKIDLLRASLMQDQVVRAAAEFPECEAAIKRLRITLGGIEEKLSKLPTIDVAVLGPSRHGKSTLLNSLVANDLLPTSDVKPCTASVLKMAWSPQWSVRVKFVSYDQLNNDWRQALQDANDELNHQREGDQSQVNEDTRFVRNVLQRFIQLFRVNPDLPPVELVEEIRRATIPHAIKKLLGQDAVVRATDVEGMRAALAKYLSTSDVYWTIVEDCEINGPFENWHHSLSLVDLPGTNDSDPQRTLVTNSVRESATAVAIVTSDSNIGPDIEEWLRNSSVLANFLESTNKRKQRLFIIRTKLDSYHPEISLTNAEISDEEESQLYLDAIQRYKTEQSNAYHSMLRDIASPKLPLGDDAVSREKRSELLSRIDDIPVFFVSALAHEAFAGRFSTSKKTMRQFNEYFDNDIDKTGIPHLRSFLLDVAIEYLAVNFFDDIEQKLESEARLLAGVFRKSISMLKAEGAGGKNAISKVVKSVQSDVLPWLRNETERIVDKFKNQTVSGDRGIQARLDQVKAMSERRLQDKMKLWSHYHWSSLRAAARKNGTHVTGRGQCIDLAEDVTSVLVDDVILAWTHFRDDLISIQIDHVTSKLVEDLSNKLKAFQQISDVPEVSNAIGEIVKQLYGITHQQRLELLQMVNDQIKTVESIRKPAYKIAQDEFAGMYGRISQEMGTGCSRRMYAHVEDYAPAAIRQTLSRVTKLISGAVNTLAQTCSSALTNFGSIAANRIDTAITHISQELTQRDVKILTTKINIANEALLKLPTI